MAKTIYINGKFLTQPVTGVQRYAYELLREFDLLLENHAVAEDIEIQCLVPPKTLHETRWKHIKVKSIGFNQGNLWEQIDLPFYLKGKFLFSPANTGPFLYRNQAVTMHDASTFAVPNAYSFSFRVKYKIIFKSLARLAKLIFTDSKFSQKELSFYLNQPPERFHVIHLAGNHIEMIAPQLDALEKYGLKKDKYILTVANQSPHKNFKTVQNAVKLIKSDIKIVFAGDRRKIFANEDSRPMPNNIILPGYIDDRELKMLYQNALGYIFPSYYEGFGLPILEAMYCGCPVLCAKAASLPEVAGDAALFFDPTNASELANAIDTIYTNSTLQLELTQKGHKRAEEFKWKSTASNTLNELLTAINANR